MIADIDGVRRATLSTVLSQVRYGGAAACGLASGFGLPAAVLPCILRGISLFGIGSVHPPVGAGARQDLVGRSLWRAV